MSTLVEISMGELNEERRPVYPLFQKSARPKDVITGKEDVELSSKKSDDRDTFNLAGQNSGQTSKITQQLKEPEAYQVAPPSTRVASASLLSSQNHAELLDVDPNSDRRKRQRTFLTEGKATHGKVQEDSRENYQEPQPVFREILFRSPIHSVPSEVGEFSEPLGVRDDHRDETSQKSGSTPVSEQAECSPEIFEIKQEPAAMTVLHKDVMIDAHNSPAQQDKSSVITTDTTSKPADHKPRKVLRLNPKTGTIGSPPAKRKLPATAEVNGKRSTVIQRNYTKSKVITIRYGTGQRLPASLGLKIDSILKSTKLLAPTAPMPSKPAMTLAAAVNPTPAQPREIHPMFLGKAALKLNAPKIKPKASSGGVDLTNSSVSPTRGRAGRRSGSGSRLQSSTGIRGTSPSKVSCVGFSSLGNRLAVIRQSSPTWTAGSAPGFGSSAKLLKFPGAVEPAWPWQGMIHIHGYDTDLEVFWNTNPGPLAPYAETKKSKCHAVEIPVAENILESLAIDLNITQIVKDIQDTNTNEYPPLPQCLRVPLKHNESGLDIQRRVRKEVYSQLPAPGILDRSSSEDELAESDPTTTHPALQRKYASIATVLSAFDKGHCETQSWPHKYAPKTAADVLQTGSEPFLLKNWLQSLTVKSVEAGLGDHSESRASSLSRKPAISKIENAGKRKRKSNKLDGFVISSDEEDDDMDEISESEASDFPPRSQSLTKKTVIRNGDMKGAKDSARLTNAVVISGPNGCGKTAAVYAAAKELGFEVFEINPSSRRSGKDIMEKVGDMTQNHLVQRASLDFQLDGTAEDRRRLDNALADDLKSGRQGTMNSFFTSKPSSMSKSKPKGAEPPARKCQEPQQRTISKTPAKKQKQSLILIEEADILYREDTQFWSTVINLILISKRPVVLTCNDESAIPLESLSLHAIMRFTPPPSDLAVDYLLLIAASEGHILRREAVKALYESRNMDLRASLTDLNFWCQFSVGDVKRGLNWYYYRGPQGRDVDKDGSTIRVVSEGTYERGMGWLSQDVLESEMHHLDIEEEILLEVWDEWHLDAGNWQKNLNMDAWANTTQTVYNTRKNNLDALAMYAEFVEDMSAADLCSGGIFSREDQIPLDPSIPSLSAKSRDDYVLSHEIMEASPLISFDNTLKSISLYLKSRCRKKLQIDQHLKLGFEVPSSLSHLSESHMLNLIVQHITKPSLYLSRRDFSLAFDPISIAEKPLTASNAVLEACSFDRNFELITIELAPYVRGIVAYDARLLEERKKLSGLVSEGGRVGKRMRTTRSAFSALGGGPRNTTRRERWFTNELNSWYVFRTGMKEWLEAGVYE